MSPQPPPSYYPGINNNADLTGNVNVVQPGGVDPNGKPYSQKGDLESGGPNTYYQQPPQAGVPYGMQPPQQYGNGQYQQQQPYPQQEGGIATGTPAPGFFTNYVEDPRWGATPSDRERKWGWVGWFCFIAGIFFPVFWVIGALLGCCARGRPVRSAALSCLIGLVVYIILAAVLGGVLGSRNRNNNNSGCYDARGNYICG